jgi:hypothetical protein
MSLDRRWRSTPGRKGDERGRQFAAGIVQLQHCVEVVVVAERRLPRVDAVGEWLTRDERKVAGR